MKKLLLWMFVMICLVGSVFAHVNCISQDTDGPTVNLQINDSCVLHDGLCTGGICDFGNLTVNSSVIVGSNNVGLLANNLTLNISGTLNISSTSVLGAAGLDNATGTGGNGGVLDITALEIVGGGGLYAYGGTGSTAGGEGGEIYVTGGTGDLILSSINAQGGEGQSTTGGIGGDVTIEGDFNLANISLINISGGLNVTEEAAQGSTEINVTTISLGTSRWGTDSLVIADNFTLRDASYFYVENKDQDQTSITLIVEDTVDIGSNSQINLQGEGVDGSNGGHGGNIDITTSVLTGDGSLYVRGATASTGLTAGNGGTITVNADFVDLANFEAQGNIAGAGGTSGDGGTVYIESDVVKNISLINVAGGLSATNTPGANGSATIIANYTYFNEKAELGTNPVIRSWNLTVDGVDIFPTRLGNDSTDIHFVVGDTLNISDGATIGASGIGDGSGGMINLTALDIIGFGTFHAYGGEGTSVGGDGGDIFIDAVNISGFETVTVSAGGSVTGVAGDAGRLSINADVISGSSGIFADGGQGEFPGPVDGGEGGNIWINVSEANFSVISATGGSSYSGDTGSGGNVTLIGNVSVMNISIFSGYASGSSGVGGDAGIFNSSGSLNSSKIDAHGGRAFPGHENGDGGIIYLNGVADVDFIDLRPGDAYTAQGSAGSLIGEGVMILDSIYGHGYGMPSDAKSGGTVNLSGDLTLREIDLQGGWSGSLIGGNGGNLTLLGNSLSGLEWINNSGGSGGTSDGSPGSVYINVSEILLEERVELGSNPLVVAENMTVDSSIWVSHVGLDSSNLSLFVTDMLNLTAGSFIGASGLDNGAGTAGNAGIIDIFALDIVGRGLFHAYGGEGSTDGGAGGMVLAYGGLDGSRSLFEIDSILVNGGNGSSTGGAGGEINITGGVVVHDLELADVSGGTGPTDGTFGSVYFDILELELDDVDSVIGINPEINAVNITLVNTKLYSSLNESIQGNITLIIENELSINSSDIYDQGVFANSLNITAETISGNGSLFSFDNLSINSLDSISFEGLVLSKGSPIEIFAENNLDIDLVTTDFFLVNGGSSTIDLSTNGVASLGTVNAGGGNKEVSGGNISISAETLSLLGNVSVQGQSGTDPNGTVSINVTSFNAFDTFTNCYGCSDFNLSFQEAETDNVLLEYPYKVNLTEPYFGNWNMSDNYVYVDSTNLPELDQPANVTLKNAGYDYYPYLDTTGDGVGNAGLCTDCVVLNEPSSSPMFSITGFSGYTSGANGNLTIFDQADNESVNVTSAFTEDNVWFYANYTDGNGDAIDNATCVYRDPQGYIGSMTYDSEDGLYKLIRQYDEGGIFSWNVSCAIVGYTDLTVGDSIEVTDQETGYSPTLINCTVFSSTVTSYLYCQDSYIGYSTTDNVDFNKSTVVNSEISNGYALYNSQIYNSIIT